MEDRHIEHRTEVRRASRATPIWMALAVIAVVVVVAIGRGDGAEEGARVPPPSSAPSTPTSETLTTTSPRDLPPVFGLTETRRGLLPFSTEVAPIADSAGIGGRPIELVGHPIVTAGQVVVLGEDASLWARQPGGSLQIAGCCWEAILPSNEPGHVWGREADQVVLVDLRLPPSEPRVRLHIGDERVLGLASFGVVTVDQRNVVRWHRPSFEPEVVPLPGDRRPIASGGERVLVEAPALDGRARLETGSITGLGRLHEIVLPAGVDADGVLSPDGAVVAVADPDGWVVRSAVRDELHGSLPAGGSRPVWAGGTRFATVVDGRLIVSDAGELPLRWPVLAVAEQSPSA